MFSLTFIITCHLVVLLIWWVRATGTSVIELITFAAFSWGSVVSFMFIGLILSCLTWQHCKQFLMDNVTLKRVFWHALSVATQDYTDMHCL